MNASDDQVFPIQILFEDECLLAVAKPPGLIVHANPVSVGRERIPEPDLESIVNDRFRVPGQPRLVLFHRLDKDTSGIVLFGKRRDTNALVSQAFEDKRIRKAYLAVVRGRWENSWSRVETWVQRAPDRRNMMNVEQNDLAKRAFTSFRVLAASDEKSLIEAMPKTGRTHQIRLHCVARARPILGDRLYNDSVVPADPPQALHAHRLDLRHPLTGQELRIRALPPSFFLDHWLQGLNVEPAWSRLFSEVALGSS